MGLGAASSALAGYLASLDYARNRQQGRQLGDKNPQTPPVMLIEHPDVRRLLMTQKIFGEGAHALLYYCAQLVDKQRTGEDNAEHIALLLELLTPIYKSWPSEFGLEANKLAIQVPEGYGYTHDFPVERFYRDNRLNHIHEGAHAIHGLDILGRKVRMHDGAALKLLYSKRDRSGVAAHVVFHAAGIEPCGIALQSSWDDAHRAVNRQIFRRDRAQLEVEQMPNPSVNT